MQTEIKRIQIATVAGNGVVNQYGDMVFKATDGNEYKLGKKRSQYFSLIQPGKTVKLSYFEYMSKEFIAEVALVEPHTTPTTQTQPSKQANERANQYNPPNKPPNAPQIVSGAEKGMMIKESGDYFRAGMFNPENQPELWAFIKLEIGRVTGVKVN